MSEFEIRLKQRAHGTLEAHTLHAATSPPKHHVMPTAPLTLNGDYAGAVFDPTLLTHDLRTADDSAG